MKKLTVFIVLVLVAAIAWWAWLWSPAGWALLVAVPLALLLIYDVTQQRHTILRNYPIFGHLRYVLEDFRTHIRQYFIQGDDEGVPFYREQRSIVYQRAKREIDSHPFGSIQNMYAVGYEWMNHSINALDLPPQEPRIVVGGDQCTQPYSASRFNISAMSFGSLSAAAIEALNRGAHTGNFFHNTGEGGISKYHLKHGGDLVWEIGTGYFGCRTASGKFDVHMFRDNARRDVVKMIELKLSQGAKPGGGGLLPGVKVSAEIAAARGVPIGRDVHSPASFDEFHTPTGLLEFVQRLREASGGKPTGFKLCIGRPVEFLAVVKAMLETGIVPDFITIDGSEGGTGAAQQELSDSIGMPLREGLMFANNALVGAGLRDRLRLIASGKVITGFDIAAKLAMGAELCNSARGFMFALGCIQARVCNKNICPTGITTMNKWRTHGLAVEDKYKRVAAYHEQTIRSFINILGACGIADPAALDPGMLNRRVSQNEIRTYRDLYPSLQNGELLTGHGPELYAGMWQNASSSHF
ncbi:MAG TPA: FMN-binding glutamate synthase family protein [Woeseiaceae bacterium]|nr:FMN-binding glutamate synthase family protein [Woeseiaceae bacterium]